MKMALKDAFKGSPVPTAPQKKKPAVTGKLKKMAKAFVLRKKGSA